MIGSVSTETHARRLSAYFLTIGIESHIEESNGGVWQVWIEHDDDLDRGKVELEQFLIAPDDAKYNGASSEAQKIRKAREKAAERRRLNYTDVRTSAAWSGLGRYGTPVALGMIAISIGLSFLTQFAGNPEQSLLRHLLFDDSPIRLNLALQGLSDETGTLDAFGRYGMFARIVRGEIWRLVTPVFLHADMFHLLFNMMWLWRFGQVIETIKGSWKFIALALALAVLSCSAQAGWDMWMQTNHIGWSLFLGMSGVNAGLFGYSWMKRKFQPYERIFVTDQELGMMLGWLAICSTGIVGNIANAAHWGGLAVGMAIGAAPTLLKRIRRK